MGRILVAYFSCSGVTARVAQTLAAAADADLHEIKPKVAYTQADLNWNDSKSRSTIEMKDQTFRPEIADSTLDITDYDAIFIGFPIWWYVAPTIINTFLESYDFSGKTIVPFATSGGSGLGKTEENLYGSCSDEATWLSGKLLSSMITEAEAREWIEALDL